MSTAPAHVRADPDSDRSPDRLLLRAFEPVLRFTDGELFLPPAVDRYVARGSPPSWSSSPGSGR